MKTYDYSKVEMSNPRVQAIIESGYNEFSSMGYKKASTNHIAEKAGVARGLIYYYFGDKEGLFKFLMDSAVDRIMQVMDANVNWKDPDLLYRISTAIRIKSQMLSDNPYIFEFLLTNMAYYKQEKINDYFKGSCVDIKQMLHEFYYSNVDPDLFKAGLDTEKTINTIRWTIERLGEEWTQKIQSGTGTMDQLQEEIDRYVAYLREVFYR
jgi:AcrR family transcriptional regulator